jgi:diguanylate cyclase (GGDEF)-like protein
MEFFRVLLLHRNIYVAWLVNLLATASLGALQHATEVEYAFASAEIIPIFFVTWAGGFRHGFAASLLAALMWAAIDIVAERQFISDWTPLINGFARLATYSFVAYMTARVRTLLQREIELASHDSLTGLLNRRAFMAAGASEVSRAVRYGHPIAVLFLDLDNFKQLNDSRGHNIGDAALTAVGCALEKSLRETDTVARLGGDEFAIILPETDQPAASEAAQKIAAAIAESLADFAPVSASIGVAWFQLAKEDFDQMLKAADDLMYEMKEDGKAGIRLRSFA